MTDSRTIDCAYEDPLDLVWLRTARELGMRVERSREVFAAWDGAGTLRIAAAEDMDADDSVDGVLVQLPLPEHMNQKRVLASVSADKDGKEATVD